MIEPATPEPHPLTDHTPRAGPGRCRLLALDIDGTVSNSRHEIDDDTVSAVLRARAAGIVVLLATGRRYRDVLPVAARLGLGGPVVTASGALVKRRADHATLFRAEFDPGVLGDAVALVVERGHDPVVYTDSFAEGFDFHCRRPPEQAGGRTASGVAEYLARNRHLARIDPDLHVALPPGVFAGFTMGAHDEMLALERALHERCPGRLALHVIRSPRYRDWMCEIAPHGVTKWSGVAGVAAATGIAAAEVCAVGDDVNDLPMIRAAGLGVAMGNAVDEVKDAADVVVADHDHGGIAEVVGMILGDR